MKKINLTLFSLILVCLSLNSTAQNKTDYFVGKWEVLVTGIPSGDAKMIISLERKEGKLDGVIKLGDETEQTKITSIDEKETSITLNFPASGYDVRLTLEKKDDNHVAGTLMDQFEAKGERILKEETGNLTAQNVSDFFAGRWDLLVTGTPNGDIKMILNLERKEGKLDGTIKIQELEPSKFTKIDEKGTTIALYFIAAGYDLFITLEKKDENHVLGKEMDMFDVKGERIVR